MSAPPTHIPCIGGNRGPVDLGIGGTFLAIAILLTGLRIFTRVRRVTAGLGWDDGFIVIAVLLACSLYGISVNHVHFGNGRHIGCLSHDDIVNANRLQAIAEVPIMISSLFSRVSICLFLLRLFAVNINWRWTLYFIIAVTVATNIACATAILSSCHPRAKMWNPKLPGRCWSQVAEVAIGQIQGSVSVFLDLFVSGLPIYCMWKIQMSWRIKAAICGIMSLGVFTACCALVRTIVLGNISSKDITWDSLSVSIAGDLEVYVAIIAANIATLRPLFSSKPKKEFRGQKLSSESKTRLKYMKDATNSNGSDRWPGASFDTNATGYTTEATADRRHDDDISLEHMGGIKRVTDVQVSV